eukprot:m.48014 g.48014  ORF g.48014 m.48014 type:complete len:424 (-) comp6012_c0_seq1:76-1347(-)
MAAKAPVEKVSSSTDTETDTIIVDESPAYLRDFLRPLLLPYVQRSSHGFVPWFQKVCGVRPRRKEKTENGEGSAASDTPDYAEAWRDPSAPMLMRVWNAILSLIFHIGSMLGSEIIYITFFPFMFWNIEPALGRRLVYLWAIQMYFGQGLKDHLKLPRPWHVNPRVRSLESDFAAEYGFPSTHTMAIMGQAVIVVVYTYREDYAGNGQYPLLFASFIAFMTTLVTALSRVYMGVHSIPDIIGGVVITFATLWTYLSFDNYLDLWLMENGEALYIPTLFFVGLLLVYPRPRTFTQTYGDTAMIAGVANGVMIGSHFTHINNLPRLPLNWLVVRFEWWIVYALLRSVLGFGMMVFVRQIIKSLCVSTLSRFLPASKTPPAERYSIVVPTKFITYTCVSATSVAVCSLIFSLMGLTAQNLEAAHPL